MRFKKGSQVVRFWISPQTPGKIMLAWNLAAFFAAQLVRTLPGHDMVH